MKVKIYSTPTFIWCAKTKEFLKQRKIPFISVNVADNSKAAREMFKKTGQTGVPVIEIKKSHSIGIIVGYDEDALKKALKIK